MSYTFYSSLHFISLLGLSLILGALWGLYTNKNDSKKLLSILLSIHGLILFFILLAGFGLIAKTNLNWSLWIYIKLILWVILGFLPLIIKKSGQKLSHSSLLHSLVLLFIFLLFLIAVLSVKLRF
ncbi:MAG: hypothetical protein GDA46_02645 [Bdellovibrionales bacterium]|nr:hypothetical protein [Bdellovibrionales bacterium]